MSRYVIQGQGYNPFTNVVQPGKDAYDCKGSSLCGTGGLSSLCDAAQFAINRDDTFIYTNQ